MSKHDIYCLNCNGDGYIITSSGRTRACKTCEGTGLTEAGLKSLEAWAKKVDVETESKWRPLA